MSPAEPVGEPSAAPQDVARDGRWRLPGELSAPEQELIAKARTGDVAELTGQTVRACVLTALCSAEGGDVDRRGVQLAGATITETIDLRSAKLPAALTLRGCHVGEPVLLADAAAPGITIEDCELVGGLDAARVSTDGCLRLAGSTIHEFANLYDARIGADLDCDFCDLRGSGVALSAQGLAVGADVMFACARAPSGAVDLQQAKVGRSAYFEGVVVTCDDGVALRLSGVQVRGDISFAPGTARDGRDVRTEIRGGIELAGASMNRLELSGAYVQGAGDPALSLWGANVERDVELEGWMPGGDGESSLWRCEIDGGAVLSAATVGGDISASGIRLAGAPTSLEGYYLRLEGLLRLSTLEFGGRLWAATAAGAVDLVGAQLQGLFARGAQLQSLSLWGAAIGRDVDLSPSVADGDVAPLAATLAGHVELAAATIRGDLRLEGAHLQATGFALGGERLDVGGTMYLTASTDGDGEPVPFRSEGTIDLQASRLGALTCDGAHLKDPEGLALRLRGATIAHDVSLQPVASDADDHAPWLRCAVEGTIDARDAAINGRLTLDGARLQATDIALTLEQAEVTRDISLAYWGPDPEHVIRCEVDGDVHLDGATVNGTLRAGGAVIHGALTANVARIAGDVELDRARWGNLILPDASGAPLRFEAHGLVSLQNTAIGGSLICRGAWMSSPGDIALNLYGIDVGSDVLLEQATEDLVSPLPIGPRPIPFQAEGTVRLFSANVGKNLSFNGADVRRGDPAVVAANVTVGGHLSLWGAAFNGLVDISRSSAATLNCSMAQFEPSADDDPGAVSFDASYFRTPGDVRWAPMMCAGSVSFHGAVAGALVDDPSTWPLDGEGGAWMDLDGFVYDALPEERDWKVRRRWLLGLRGQTPQPYRQLAAAYSKSGDETAARKINMERFNVRLRHGVHPWRWILRFGIGHGYEPWRAIGPLLAVWLVAWWVTWQAADSDAMKPTRSGVSTSIPATDCDRTDYPCLQPWLYAADLVVPVVNLGQRERWTPAGDKSYELLPPLATLAGWILTTLVVAGFTGLVRRE